MVKKSPSYSQTSSNSYQKLKKSQKSVFTGGETSPQRHSSQTKNEKSKPGDSKSSQFRTPNYQNLNLKQKQRLASHTNDTPKQSQKNQNQSDQKTKQTKQTKKKEPINQPHVELERSRIAPGYYRPVKEQTIFEWTQMSRPYKEKNRSFLKSVIVISSLLIIISILINKVLIAAVIASIAFLTYVLNVIPPDKSEYEITTHGIKIDEKLYSWAILTRFWFDHNNGQETINIECLVFPNRLTLVINKEDKKRLTALLEEVLLNQKPKANFYEKVISWFHDKFSFE